MYIDGIMAGWQSSRVRMPITYILTGRYLILPAYREFTLPNFLRQVPLQGFENMQLRMDIESIQACGKDSLWPLFDDLGPTIRIAGCQTNLNGITRLHALQKGYSTAQNDCRRRKRLPIA